MLCSGVNRRSRLNDTMTESTKIGCLATMKFSKKLKGLKQKKVVPQTPAGGRGSGKIPEGKMHTPQNPIDDKENASSTGMTCRTASRLNGLGVRGQIKVSLEVENGLLTVHVVEGKQLKFKSGSSRNSYVQVSIMPEDDSMMRYTTRIQYNTASPRYDETFRHKLSMGDDRKRVFIAVWSECGIHSQLVGCMSFGVKHLLHKWKSVAGWFYLLSEELGAKKHLKMFSSRQALHETTNAKSSSTDLSHNSSMTLLVTPNPAQHGYGFSVSGSSPSEVSQVIPGSAAYVAGLQPGDIILKIDTQNVAKSNGASINKIIQEANETLVMEVKRNCDPTYESVPRVPSRSRLVPCSSMSTLNSWVPFDDNNNNHEDLSALKGKRTASRSSLNSMQSSKSRASSQNSYQSVSRSKDGSLKRMASQGSLKSTKRLEPISEENSPASWQPTCQQNLSNDSDFTYHWKQSRKSCDGESDHGLQYLEKDCWEIVAQLDKAAIPKKPNASMVPNASLSTNANDSEVPYDVTGTTFRDDTYAQWANFQMSATETSMGATTFFSCTTETQHMVSLDSGYSIGLESTQGMHQSSIFADPVLSDIAEQLLNCEDEFARKMHFGTERFSRPLRHCIISPTEQKILFQNVEKLVAISEFHVKKLNELKYEAGSGVSAAYMSQLALTCDAYTIYCKGLARSLSLLDDFSENKEFLRFVQEPEVPEDELNITEFLEKPLLHLEELVYLLSQLVNEMPENDLDYANMRHVLSALKGCYTNLQAEFTLLQDDGDSEDEYIDETADFTAGNVSEADRVFESHLAASQTAASSQSMSSTVFSIDAELAALQNKLFFPSDVQPFQIVGPNRHIIYQGDLLFVHAWNWYKLNVILLSDQLLLTKEESPDKLVAIMPPVFLKDICSWDFDGFHPAEFVLMLDNEESILRDEDSTVEPRLQSLVFRAMEVEQKSTWRHLLEQRVRSCRAQREYCL